MFRSCLFWFPPRRLKILCELVGSFVCVCVCVAAGGAYGDHYDAPDTRDCQFLFNKDSVHCVCVCVCK